MKMGQRILLVEDNIQASNVVKDYFEKNGCDVEAAYDGLTGLKMARSNEYDIIFLDAMMPGMDGFTFLKNIREEKNIPIIMLTSLADEENMLKLIKNVIASGHHSTIEHIQVSFAISNVSRACTHQLVRHRLMSFSQKSQRYVQEKGQFDYIIPPTIDKNPELRAKFVDFMSVISNKYQEFVEAGIPAEDARFVLPNAARL